MTLNIPGKLLCRVTLALRWGDMDALGHVNNTVFFRLAEEVRVLWFTRMGLYNEPVRTHGTVLAEASMRFLRQLHYPGSVLVSMTGAEPGRSSFETHYVLADPQDSERVYAQGVGRCVWIDFASGKSHPMPQFLREEILNPSPVLITPQMT